MLSQGQSFKKEITYKNNYVFYLKNEIIMQDIWK